MFSKLPMKRKKFMVLWCRSCNALIGVREPISNWATDRTGICALCLEKEVDITKYQLLNDVADKHLPPEGPTRPTA